MQMDLIPDIRKIDVGPETLKNLNTTRKWTMFLSVSGFIFLGLIIVLGLLSVTFLSTFHNSDRTQGLPDALVLIGFIGLILINFFPIYFLFRFSKHASTAVSAPGNRDLHKAFNYLKCFFLFLGVLLIVVILVYIIGLIVAFAYPDFFNGL